MKAPRAVLRAHMGAAPDGLKHPLGLLRARSSDRLCQVRITEAFRIDRTGNYELKRAQPDRARGAGA